MPPFCHFGAPARNWYPSPWKTLALSSSPNLLPFSANLLSSSPALLSSSPLSPLSHPFSTLLSSSLTVSTLPHPHLLLSLPPQLFPLGSFPHPHLPAVKAERRWISLCVVDLAGWRSCRLSLWVQVGGQKWRWVRVWRRECPPPKFGIEKRNSFDGTLPTSLNLRHSLGSVNSSYFEEG